MSKESKNLIIEVTEPRAVELPEWTVPGTDVVLATKLVPGENNVDERYWKFATKNPGVKIWLAAGVLKNKGEGEANELAAMGLDGVTVKEAQDKIASVKSLAILNQWKSTSTKKGILTALDNRIREIIKEQDGGAE